MQGGSDPHPVAGQALRLGPGGNALPTLQRGNRGSSRFSDFPETDCTVNKWQSQNSNEPLFTRLAWQLGSPSPLVLTLQLWWQ